jgi:hypothetical protein
LKDPGAEALFLLLLFQGPEGPCSLGFALSREGLANSKANIALIKAYVGSGYVGSG